MTTGSVIWRWNEVDTSQFEDQLNIGPVTGTVTLSVKQPTGSFSVRPTIRADLSLDFRTPSGSIALIPIKDLTLPKNFRTRFVANHFGTVPNLSLSSAIATRLKWGLMANASSGSARSDYCGTFYSMPFFTDQFSQPLPLNGGFQDSDNNTTWTNDFRLGMVSSSYSLQDWSLKHLSLTGSSINGADFEASVESVKNTSKANESTYATIASSKSQYYSNIHWSGSLFAGKILDKTYLAFYYNPITYIRLTSAYVEFDSFQFLKHNDGDGVEFQPPPVTSSLFFGEFQPISFSSSLTYWAPATSSLFTLSGSSKIVALSRFSGSNHTFGNSLASAPITGTLVINSFTASTIFFSGATNLTSSTNHSAYVSGTAFRNYYVVNILTASANSANRYSNHVIHGDVAGWWGVFFRNNGNGSGTLDCYGWVTGQVTASFNFKYNQPFMFEYWRDTNFLYARVNNTGSLFSASIAGTIPVASGNPSRIGEAGTACQWHLLEMVTTNANSTSDINSLAVGNYLAAKYGFPNRAEITVIGGEAW
jgi:hypothetical protein